MSTLGISWLVKLSSVSMCIVTNPACTAVSPCSHKYNIHIWLSAYPILIGPPFIILFCCDPFFEVNHTLYYWRWEQQHTFHGRTKLNREHPCLFGFSVQFFYTYDAYIHKVFWYVNISKERYIMPSYNLLGHLLWKKSSTTNWGGNSKSWKSSRQCHFNFEIFCTKNISIHAVGMKSSKS